jgi:glycine dehydrogenase subunit 2
MKHNPRLNEKMARLPGFADIHPLQPQDSVQGALELIETLGEWLVKLTGMHSVAMSPKAGAHGELCGLLAIRSALEARGDKREVVLVPESAHGTNPATAAFAGYRVENIPATERGRVDLEALKARLGPDVAGRDDHQSEHLRPVRAGHDRDQRGGPRGRRLRLLRRGQFQRDRRARAAGRPRHRCDAHQPAQDLLHPPWRRRTGFRAGGFLRGADPFAPLPFVEKDRRRLPPGRGGNGAGASRIQLRPDGRLPRPDGMFTRALSYILSHGADGLRQVAEDAVLNANYILRSLEDVLDAPFGESGPCMHEALFSDKGFGNGLTTLDLAKG